MRKLIILTAILLSFGCVKEDHFGKSDRAEIKTFTLPQQSGNTTIDNENGIVKVPVSESTTDFNLVPTEIKVSNFASLSPGAGVERNFSDTVEYTVRAENGNVRVYKVIAERAGSQPQLDSSSFENWYIETVLGSGIEILHKSRLSLRCFCKVTIEH